MKLYILLFALIIGNTSFADPLDGLAIFDLLIYVLLTGAVCIVILFFSTILRFARKEYKVSIPLNFSASALIFCALISMGNLGPSIDPGFSACCIGIIIISILLIILNYRIGLKNKEKD